MGQRALNIGLDSTIFRNRPFLEWLREIGGYSIHISIIVYVETLLWYKALGLTKEDFDSELVKLRSEKRAITDQIAESTTTLALRYRREYPFRQHARDYVIGTTAAAVGAALITYNTDDFRWLRTEGHTVLTPEELVAQHLREGPNS